MRQGLTVEGVAFSLNCGSIFGAHPVATLFMSPPVPRNSRLLSLSGYHGYFLQSGEPVVTAQTPAFC